jgi:hypothetical protein
MFQIWQELARQSGTRYAVDGSGQRIDPIPLGYGSSTQNPAVTAATQAGQGAAPPFPLPPIARWNRMEEQAGQPGGIRPPWTVPQSPVGANPGMGGAIIGDGRMNPGIPPQQPPADGSSPLPVWAGEQPQQQGGPLNINVRGGQQAPALTPAQRYALANQTGQIAAQQRQAQATGQSGGYQYKDGQKVGYATQTIGNKAYIPFNPSAAYGLANAAGQVRALNKQATATGQTGVYNYVNGQKTGTVGGGTSAQAYERAAARSRDPGTSGEGGNPSWW